MVTNFMPVIEKTLKAEQKAGTSGG
jgi:acyl-CoA thioesterase-1